MEKKHKDSQTDGSGVTWSLAFREQKVRPNEAAASREGPWSLLTLSAEGGGLASSLQRPRLTWEAPRIV